MDVLFFCTRWGSEHIPWPEFLTKVKNAGYDGVETSLPLNVREQDEIVNAITKAGLKLIAVHWDTGTSNVQHHRQEMEGRLLVMAACKPLFITSHTGKDHFTFEQNAALLHMAEHISDRFDVPILHETHRGKFSFCAHITQTYLEKMPWLKLTLDVSHWFNVAESYLHDQQPALQLALNHTAHIHSRVGFTQGPQIPDPREAFWQDALQHHLKCWDAVYARQKENGARQFTITTEFGPFPYMQLYAGNQERAVQHQWEINYYMKQMLKERYSTVYPPLN